MSTAATTEGDGPTGDEGGGPGGMQTLSKSQAHRVGRP